MKAVRRAGTGRVLLAAAVTTVLLTTVLTEPAISAASTTRGDTVAGVRAIGHAPDGYTLGGPHVLVTASDVTLVAWREYGGTPNSLRLVRRTTTSFKPVAIKPGPLTEFGEPYLTEDLVNHRLLLTAFGQSDGATNLGLYVWTSTNDGATWSTPKRVWDSFATGQIALDRTGGFYAITDQTEVSVTHVPKSLTMQVWPADDIYLSDRISSRGGLGIATVGPDHVLVVAFVDPSGRPFLHLSTREGSQFDTEVDVCCAAEPYVQLASSARGAVLAFQYVLDDGSRFGYELQAASIEELASGEIVVDRTVPGTKDDVTWLAVNPLPASTAKATWKFQLVWLDSSGRLRESPSIATGDDHLKFGPAETLLRFPTDTFQFPGPIAASGSWVVSHAYDGDLTEVQIALPD